MVFQPRKRRYGAKPKQKTTQASIKDLPDELLLEVFEHTPLPDVLKLREAGKYFVPACSTVVRARLKVLYVHPSPSSVRRATKICHSDLASEVQEICLVNKIFWYRIRQNPTRIQAHTWPIRNTYSKKSKLSRGDADDLLAFRQDYEELLSSLAMLKNIKALSFADKCSEPGFNMVPTHSIIDWKTTVLPGLSNMKTDTNQRTYALNTVLKPAANFRFADIDAFMSIFSRPDFKLTTLRICDELPFADHITLSPTPQHALTHIELHINTGWPGIISPWESFCRSLLRSAAPTLQDLKFAFQYNAASSYGPRSQVADTNLHAVTADLAFPDLRHLELRALQPGPRSELAQTQQLPVSVVQAFDLPAFVAERCPKLRFIRLAGVVPQAGITTLIVVLLAMGELVFDFGPEARELERVDEHTRAWEIGV